MTEVYTQVVVNEFTKMSPRIDTLAAALSLAQASLHPAKMTAVNPHFKSKFADLHAIIETSKKPLTDNGLSICQAAFGQPPLVGVTTILLHKSGQWISGQLTMRAGSEDPQKMGAAITYAKRYGLAAMLNIAAEEDDDGNSAVSPTINQTHPLPAKAYNNSPELPPMDDLSDKTIADYVIDLGPKNKLSGKHLFQVSSDDIKESLAFWASKGQLTGKPYIFCKNAQAYLESQKKKPLVKEDFPPFTDLDEPPF